MCVWRRPTCCATVVWPRKDVMVMETYDHLTLMPVFASQVEVQVELLPDQGPPAHGTGQGQGLQGQDQAAQGAGAPTLPGAAGASHGASGGGGAGGWGGSGGGECEGVDGAGPSTSAGVGRMQGPGTAVATFQGPPQGAPVSGEQQARQGHQQPHLQALRQRQQALQQREQALQQREQALQQLEQAQEQHEQALDEYEQALQQYEHAQQQHQPAQEEYRRARQQYQQAQQQHRQTQQQYHAAQQQHRQAQLQHEQAQQQYQQAQLQVVQGQQQQGPLGLLLQLQQGNGNVHGGPVGGDAQGVQEEEAHVGEEALAQGAGHWGPILLLQLLNPHPHGAHGGGGGARRGAAGGATAVDRRLYPLRNLVNLEVSITGMPAQGRVMSTVWRARAWAWTLALCRAPPHTSPPPYAGTRPPSCFRCAPWTPSSAVTYSSAFPHPHNPRPTGALPGLRPHLRCGGHGSAAGGAPGRPHAPQQPHAQVGGWARVGGCIEGAPLWYSSSLLWMGWGGVGWGSVSWYLVAATASLEVAADALHLVFRSCTEVMSQCNTGLSCRQEERAGEALPAPATQPVSPSPPPAGAPLWTGRCCGRCPPCPP